MTSLHSSYRAARPLGRPPGFISNRPAATRPKALPRLLWIHITITALLAQAAPGAAAAAGTGTGQQPAGTAAAAAAAEHPHRTQHHQGRWRLAQQRPHAAELSTRVVRSRHESPASDLTPHAAAAVPPPPAAHHAASPPATTSSSTSSSNRPARRRLQQFPLPLTDLYSGGVTPGFFNFDQNPVTGTHVDAGGVAVDVSADKNYLGLGVGNLFGVGIARNRGWNVQVGGGNVLDVSVTKDAGIGLWVLDGLININIMPDGTWGLGTIAARGTINEAVAASSTPVTSVVVDDTTATVASSQAATGFTSGSSVSSSVPSVAAAYTPASPNPAAAPPVIIPLPVPVTVADPTAVEAPAAQYTDYDDSSWVDVAPAPAAPWPTIGSGSRVGSSAAPALPSSYLVSRPAAASPSDDDSDASSEDDALWSVASSYSDTQAASASRLAAGGGSGSTASARQPCQGGTVLWVSGSKYKCKYKRAALVRVASGLTTYSSGIVTR